jgi:hypothetical protein
MSARQAEMGPVSSYGSADPCVTIRGDVRSSGGNPASNRIATKSAWTSRLRLSIRSQSCCYERVGGNGITSFLRCWRAVQSEDGYVMLIFP